MAIELVDGPRLVGRAAAAGDLRGRFSIGGLLRTAAGPHFGLKVEAACIKAMQEGQNEKYDQLRAEQKALGTFRPWMNHSLTEKSPTVVIHHQLLQD